METLSTDQFNQVDVESQTEAVELSDFNANEVHLDDVSDTDKNTGEWVADKPMTMIDVRRHSQYNDSFPKAGWGKATKEEKDSLGHLTAEGIENAHRIARELIEKRIDQVDGNIDFLVISSPTSWLGDEQLGQRAIETAKIYSDEIQEALASRGMPEDHLLNAGRLPSSQHEVGNVRVSKRVIEAQIFDGPKVLPVIDSLREKYGGQGKEFWDAWYAGTDNEVLDPVGAERSTETADRADKLIEALTRYGDMHNQATGRNLEVIVITHHEVLQPYALHTLGVSQKEFTPDKNEGFEILSQNGKAVARVAGHEIERVSRYNRRHDTTQQK